MSLFSQIKNLLTAPRTSDRFEMLTQRSGSIYGYSGKLYESDLIRAAIRPKARAIGKAIGKHMERDQKTGTIRINAQPYMRFLLDEPNEYMTGQILQEKLAVQLELNNNAFAYIEHDGAGYPVAIYPIDCANVELAQDETQELYLRFYMLDGRIWTAKYRNIIHLRKDYSGDTFFGSSPGKALASLMEVVAATDQGTVNAIKNGALIRWILKYKSSLKPKDLETNAKQFAQTYTATDATTGGVAAVGADADITQVNNQSYLPNAAQNANTIKRVLAFFNTNEKIIESTYTEDEWISYYEAVIEPDLVQLSNEYTRKLFTRKERSFGNKIIFTASNLTFASMGTKLQLVQLVDRGIMTPNEVRDVLGYAPVDGGDDMIRRLDTRPTKEGS